MSLSIFSTAITCPTSRASFWVKTQGSRRQPVWRLSVLPDEESELACPGTIVYKRSAFKTHYEYETSLESLGLKNVSSNLSRAMATSMGLRSAEAAETLTPVIISFDVIKQEKDLRLDGIVRTAVSLQCNRCLSAVAEKIFANFSLLLTEKAVEEPSQSTIGVVVGEETDPDKETLDLDLDDKIHFPAEVKQVDISSYIRDTVHLEMPFHSLCSSSCKGLCFVCCANLNKARCSCKATTEYKVISRKR